MPASVVRSPDHPRVMALGLRGPQGSFTDGMGGVGGPKAEPLPGEVCKASNTVVGDLVHLISAGFLLLLHMLE